MKNTPASQPASAFSPPTVSLSAHRRSTQWSRQVQRLQHQLQKHLIKTPSGEQASHALKLASDGDCLWLSQKCSTQGCITQECSTQKPRIRWFMSVDNTAHSPEWFAHSGIVEYWFLNTQQVELNIYRCPTDDGYQERHLLHVGDFSTLLIFPSLVFEVQEPLPLHFLTRTASGVKAYTMSRLPLKFVPAENFALSGSAITL